jgi:hypothetical protein
MSFSIFILKASGPSMFFDAPLDKICAKAFRTREQAEAHKEDFSKKCTTPVDEDDVLYMDKVTRCVVLKLELEDYWDEGFEAGFHTELGYGDS